MSLHEDEDYEDEGFGESSQYAAHLDRGWSLLDRGDLEAARTSAEAARELRDEAPDSAMLLGAVALAEHRPEESLRWYETAAELDPDYFEPYAAAAQICLFDLSEPVRALHFCEEAMEIEPLHPVEDLDIRLLAAECELALANHEAAASRLAQLDTLEGLRTILTHPEGEATPADAVLREFLSQDEDGEPLAEEERADRLGRLVHFAYRASRAHLDLRQPEAATALLQPLVSRFPDEADAWYMLSEAELTQGSVRNACQAALRTYKIDGQLRAPSWAPSAASIHRRVVQILSECPEPALQSLVGDGADLMVIVHDAPSLELVMEGVDPRICAIALAGRIPQNGDPELTSVAVYRRNLLRLCRGPEQFDDELRYALLDELSAFFRLDDRRRQALGLHPMGDMLTAETATPDEDGTPEDGKKRSRRARRKRA